MSLVKKLSLLDTSGEFLIRRWGNGVKLVVPEKNPEQALLQLAQTETSVSVTDLMKTPFNVYFLNKGSVLQNTNQPTVESTGFRSKKEAVGRTVYDVLKTRAAQHCVTNDLDVIRLNHIKIVEEPLTRVDDLEYYYISVKFPWYDEMNKIVGVFGVSLNIKESGDNPLPEHLELLSQTGLLKPIKSPFHNILPTSGLTIGNTYISKREAQCLYYRIQGKTAKGIAAMLNISPKTVENYLQNLKFKLNVSYSSELIEKVLKHFSDNLAVYYYV